MSLRALARQLGVSPATLSGIENGRTEVGVERLAAAATALGVSAVGLLPVRYLVTPPSAGVTKASSTGGSWRAFEPLDLDPVLRSALAGFLEAGYHGCTIRDIAVRAGLSVSALYNYHASKQAMLVALLDLAMTDLLRRSAQALEEGQDCVERFASVVESLALYHVHRTDLAFIGSSEMRSLESPHRERIGSMRTEQQRMVDREVLAGVATGVFTTPRPRESARAVVTMCTALAQWFDPAGSISADDIARSHTRFALNLVEYKPRAHARA